jgi:hypothetical protein
LKSIHVIAGWSAKRGMPVTHERRLAVVFMGGRDKPGHDGGRVFQLMAPGAKAPYLDAQCPNA